VQAYVDLVQQQFACVTSAVVDVAGGYHVSDQPHILSAANGDEFSLRGSARVMLRAAQWYEITTTALPSRRFIVELTGYFYTLLDHNLREMVAFHWHPTANSHVRTPHLHLGPGSQVGRAELQRSHLPTGFVELQQVLRLLIEEFDVTPLRDDWGAILR